MENGNEETRLIKPETALTETGDHQSLTEKMADMLQATSMMAAAQRQIVETAVGITTPKDWTNQGGKPYLTEPGAMRVASVLPIKTFCISPPRKQFGTESDHPYYIYTCEYGAAWKNGLGEASAIGTCSSKDMLYAKRGEDFLPMAEVDEPNVIKKCCTNGRNNAVKRLLGLQNMTWQELEALGIKQSDVTSVKYGTNKVEDKNPAEAEDLRKKIREMILEMSNGDVKAAQDYLENITSFKGRDGNQVKGKRETKYLSEAQAKVTYGKVKKEYEEWEKETK